MKRMMMTLDRLRECTVYLAPADNAVAFDTEVDAKAAARDINKLMPKSKRVNFTVEAVAEGWLLKHPTMDMYIRIEAPEHMKPVLVH